MGNLRNRPHCVHMKIVLFDEVYNTKSLSPLGIEFMGQDRLDQWLGKDKVKLEVKQLDAKVYKFTIWRTYGRWYEDPKRFSDCNERIVDIDAMIIKGEGYQTGTVADFSEHPGWCIWNPDIKSIFLPEMRVIAKKHHGARIKSMEVDNNLDHIDLTITYR